MKGALEEELLEEENKKKKRLKSPIKELGEHLCGIAMGIRRVSYILSALKI